MLRTDEFEFLAAWIKLETNHGWVSRLEGHLVEIRRWRYAVTLAQELHFGRAARRHFLTESHFGREIRRLELEVGERLFNRTSRRVGLTAAGEALISESTEAIAWLDQAKVRSGLGNGSADIIRVGVMGFGIADLWDPYKESILATHPGLDIRFLELSLVDQYRAVVSGRVDIGIVQNTGPYDGLEFSPVFHSERLAVVRSDSIWASAGQLEDADFKGVRFLPFSNHRYAAWAGSDFDGNMAAVKHPAAIAAAVAATGLPSLHAAPAHVYYPHPSVRYIPIYGQLCEIAIANRIGDHREVIQTFRSRAREIYVSSP